MKKWEELVRLKVHALQAEADAKQIIVECGQQTQELAAAQARLEEAKKAYEASKDKAKQHWNEVMRYIAEKEFDEEEAQQYIRVIPEFHLSLITGSN